ncbi:MAG: LysM peptidoglycan-binding domain-containing protein [Bdellovibrionales bacterium]|nr:LysM peptidoglycan-binding domain-containing protein [Bdellovibrionales bacterium]
MKRFGSFQNLWLRGAAMSLAWLVLSVGSTSCSSRHVVEDGTEAEADSSVDADSEAAADATAEAKSAEAGSDEEAPPTNVTTDSASGATAATETTETTEIKPELPQKQASLSTSVQDANTVPVEAVPPVVAQRQEEKKAARVARKAAAVPAPVAKTQTPAHDAMKVEAIQKLPFERNGALMNAFYFVRGEGSWVDLAQKIYRDPARSEDLKLWNPEAQITTGTVVYYSSPVRVGQNQGEMKPFYEDFGATAESYTVQKGDTIAKLAQVKLGSPHSRVEIVSANPGIDFRKLAPGTTILIPPAQVDNAKIFERLAQEQLELQRKKREAEEAARMAEAAQAAKAAQASSQSQPQAAVASSTEGRTETDPKRTPAAWENGTSGKVLETLSAALPFPPHFLGAGLLVFMGVAFLLRRRFQ